MTISILSLIVASMASWEYMDVLAANADKFNYHKTIGNNYGPADWDKVSCSNKDTCPGWPTDFENMSPWIRYSANTCKDCSHRKSGLKFGKCSFNQTQFHILPHVLRVEWPKNCPVTPQIDFSRGSPDPWNMRFMDFTIPSQHTIDGKRYPAEITLSHTYSVDKRDKRRFIGNLNFLVEIGSDSNHNAFLELFLARFEQDAKKIKRKCSSRRNLEVADKEATVQPRRKLTSLSALDNGTGQRSYKGKFHPYVWYQQAGTQYYFRYRGSWVEPPCLEDMTAEWRVMKDTIKISRAQFKRLERLFLQRLNPKTCVRESAGKPRPGITSKMDFNRPIQTTTKKHGLMFCECVDFDPQTAKDKAYCAKSMKERGVFVYGK